MTCRTLIALPVYNEAAHVAGVLDEVLCHGHDVLVVDDGSTDGTSGVLTARSELRVITHQQNRGYGAALQSALEDASRGGYDVLVTIDCDGQHQPGLIPKFVGALDSPADPKADVVSGSRYLKQFAGDNQPPEDRRNINRLITAELNRRLGLNLTDAFCGFKAYRVASLSQIELTDSGYAAPLEFWVQAAELALRIIELPVPLIYLDENRSFGGALDDADTRLAVYRRVLQESLAARRSARSILVSR